MSSSTGSAASSARSIDQFECLEQIGEGQYGKVWLARGKSDSELVALKKVKMDNEKEGFPITAIREIKILKNLKHPNIVQLKEIVTSKASDANKQKGSVYMVFEYAEHDLAGLMLSPKVKLEKGHIKAYLKQLLEGLHYLHTQKILHRDIKGANLLITNEGVLKIADFGLARSYNDPSVPLTKKVITLWYRPPEVLLESDRYGAPADIWSVGCIMTELLLKYSLNTYRNIWSFDLKENKWLEGPHNEMEQINKIFEVCGTPTPKSWPAFEKLPGKRALNFKQRDSVLRQHLERHCGLMGEGLDRPAITPGADGKLPCEIDLCERLLTVNPDQRITAKDALHHDYFWSVPLPTDQKAIPKHVDAHHEWQVKKKRQMEKNKNAAAAGHPGGGPSGAMPGAGRPGGEPPSKVPRVS